MFVRSSPGNELELHNTKRLSPFAGFRSNEVHRNNMKTSSFLMYTVV